MSDNNEETKNNTRLENKSITLRYQHSNKAGKPKSINQTNVCMQVKMCHAKDERVKGILLTHC